MELVGEADGVRWFNDSKATNAASAAPALAAFPPAPDQRLHWIAGGQAKGAGPAPCPPWFGHIQRAYQIGSAPRRERVCQYLYLPAAAVSLHTTNHPPNT